jgi:hypothetical protein
MLSLFKHFGRQRFQNGLKQTAKTLVAIVMKHKLLIIIAIFASNFILADGPPIDSTGKILTSYFSIKLDSNQIRHLQNNRWLELTAEQKKKLHFLDLPKYVDIVDPYHHECTCGQIYGMWYTIDSIAFALKDTNKLDKHDLNDDVFNAYNTNDFLNPLNPNDLFITTTGLISYMGEIVEIKNISDKLCKIQIKKNDKIKYIAIYQPPLKHNKSKDKVIATKAKLAKSIPADLDVYWR